MRFYIDGIEIDVSNEPLFYMPLDKVNETIKTLTHYKNDNTPTMAQR